MARILARIQILANVSTENRGKPRRDNPAEAPQFHNWEASPVTMSKHDTLISYAGGTLEAIILYLRNSVLSTVSPFAPQR
jgi:hypothetical protein